MIEIPLDLIRQALPERFSLASCRRRYSVHNLVTESSGSLQNDESPPRMDQEFRSYCVKKWCYPTVTTINVRT